MTTPLQTPPKVTRIKAMRMRWNAWFRGDGNVDDLAPNRLLTDSVRALTPGRALDVGTGQGRNALYLAAQGWDVTAIDIAEAGLDIVERNARAQGHAIQTVHGDAARFDWGVEQWDLITLIYEGPEFFDRVLPALKPAGIVVVEYFHRDALGGIIFDGLTCADLRRAFGKLEELVCYEAEDIAEFTQQRVKLVRYVGRKQSP